MKASSISLLYAYQKRVKKDGQMVVEEQQHMINLIDSPGHVDFSSEVSSALRLSDGGVVLVDVNEGISPQTHTVIKQAYAEKIKMALVLNKIDRLIIERGMDGTEIYHNLQQTVENVNSIISELIKAELLEDESLTSEQFDNKLEEKEQEMMFKPETGNVCFASAIDCWSFTLPGFIPNIAKKLGMNGAALLKFMWEGYYYNHGTKQISKQPPSAGSKIMFVQLVMDPLVERYLKFFDEETRHNTSLLKERHQIVKEKFSQLMPMEHGIMKMVVDHLPSPSDA